MSWYLKTDVDFLEESGIDYEPPAIWEHLQRVWSCWWLCNRTKQTNNISHEQIEWAFKEYAVQPYERAVFLYHFSKMDSRQAKFLEHKQRIARK